MSSNLQILTLPWQGCTLSWNVQVWRIWKIKEQWSQTSLILYNWLLVESPTTRHTWTCLPLRLLFLFQLFKISKFDLIAISPGSDPPIPVTWHLHVMQVFYNCLCVSQLWKAADRCWGSLSLRHLRGAYDFALGLCKGMNVLGILIKSSSDPSFPLTNTYWVSDPCADSMLCPVRASRTLLGCDVDKRPIAF